MFLLLQFSSNHTSTMDVTKLSFSTSCLLATFVQLPPSMMSGHTFPITIHLQWKIYLLWVSSSSIFILPNNLLTIKRSPSKGYTSHSLSSLSQVYDSPAKCLLMYFLFSNNIIVLLLGYSTTICPLPKHLKHFFN